MNTNSKEVDVPGGNKRGCNAARVQPPHFCKFRTFNPKKLDEYKPVVGDMACHDISCHRHFHKLVGQKLFGQLTVCLVHKLVPKKALY